MIPVAGLLVFGGLSTILSVALRPPGEGPPRTLANRLADWPPAATSLDRRAADLAVTDTTRARYVASHLRVALGLTTAMAVVASVHQLAGGPSVTIAVAVVGLPFLAWPAAQLRSAATSRRRTFLVHFSGFCDLVAIAVAGGQGVETSLRAAANQGTSWVAQSLHVALEDATSHARPPWWGLRRLADQLDVADLAEFAALLALAGNEGGRLESSIAAKAATLRHRVLADTEARAGQASERMAVPVCLLLAAYVVLIAYPPLHALFDA